MLVMAVYLADQIAEANGMSPRAAVCDMTIMNDFSLEERINAVEVCPAEIAIDIYLGWRYLTRPPNHDLAGPLIARGPEIVMPLLVRIEKAQELFDFVYVPDALFLLHLAQRQGYLSVHDDDRLMGRLRVAVHNMRLPPSQRGDPVYEHAFGEIMQSVVMYMEWLKVMPASVLDGNNG